MKRRHCIAFLGLLFLATAGTLPPSWAQATGAEPPETFILTIRERDQDTSVHPVASIVGISDVNSTLLITLNQEVLQQKLTQHGLATLPEGTLGRVQRLGALAKEQTAAIAALQEALKTWDALSADPAKLEEFQGRLTTASLPVSNILNEALKDPVMAEEIGKGLGSDEAENYRVVFAAATREVERLQQLISKQTTYVQFGAKIATAKETRPLHLEGFDTYAPGEPYEVTRWASLQLTDEEKNALTQMAQDAANANQASNAFLAYLKSEGLTKIADGLVSSRSLQNAELLRAKTKDAAEKLAKSGSPLQSFVTAAWDDLGAFVTHLTEIQQKYKKGSSVHGLPADDLLIQTNSDLQGVVDMMSDLAAKLGTYAQQFEDAAKSASKSDRDILMGLAKTYGSALSGIRQEAGGWLDQVRTQIAVALHGRTFDIKAYELGEQVLKLDLSILPGSTELPLMTTGHREPGDAVLMTVQAGDATRTDPIVLERQQVSLYQVIPHTQRLVGMIFASNDGRFQAAPSYSYVVKGLFDERRRRKSVRYNELYDPGFGINVSALHFDQDDSTEVGVGLTFTVFRDLLQFGYGYNTSVGQGFGFFGLQLGKAF